MWPLLKVFLWSYLLSGLISCDDSGGEGGNSSQKSHEFKITLPPPITLANRDAYKIAGTCSTKGENITVTVGALPPVESTCDEDYQWQATIDASSINTGDPLSITATELDTPIELKVERDTTPPQVGIDDDQAIINSINQGNYRIAGTCDEVDEEVVLDVEGEEVKAICDGSKWTTDSIDLSELDAAVDQVSVTADLKDKLGNPARQATETLDRDIIAPATPTITASAPINGESINSYSLSGGCAEDGTAAVTVKIAGLSDQIIDCAGQLWNLDVPLSELNKLPPEQRGITLIVEHRDSAGNVSNTSGTVDKDTVLPTASLKDPTEINRINDSAYLLTGACSEDDREVEITLSDSKTTPQQVSDTTTCAGTSWQKVLDITALQEGNVTITIAHTDLVGNPAAFDAVSVNRDNSPVITLEGPVDITSNNELNYELSGTCSEEGEEVTVSLTDSENATAEPSVQPLCGSLEWSVSEFDVSALKDGADNVQVAIAHGTATPATATVSKGCFAGGSGSSAGDPVVICDYAGLKNIASSLDKHYALGDHIDASASWSEGAENCTAYDGTTVPAATDEITPCLGMTPLGTDSTPFTGSFDGNDFEISKLYINASVIYAGLFGKVDSSETTAIKNVHLRSVLVKNNQTAGASSTGGLAGRVNGAVNNCSVTGKVVGKTYAGGLIGRAGEVVNSYADVVVGGGTYLGGLICEGHIYNSYAKGDVSGTYNSGGLAAFSNHIRNSYANVKVSHASLSTGSVLGGPRGGEQITLHNVYGLGLTIGNHFTTGGVTGSIISPHSENSITNAFWDIQTTGVSTSFTSVGVASTVGGLTTEQMQVACSEESTTGICALGGGFVFEAGKYPKVKKCLSNCDSDNPTFSNELVGGQEE